MRLTKPIYTIDLTKRGDGKPIGEPTLPFNKFYLVPGEAAQHTGRFTPYSFTLPLTKDYKTPLKEHGLDVVQLQKEGYKVVVSLHMAVVVNKRGVRTAKIHPTSIAKAHWRYSPNELSKFVPDNAPLRTPEGTLESVCAYCVRSLEHMAGVCHLGTPDCVQSLELDFTPLNLDKLKGYTNPDTAVNPPPPPPLRRRFIYWKKK